MLKYIIFTETSGEESALFGLAPTKHLELSLMAQAYKPGRRIVSAGFVEFIYGEPTPAIPHPEGHCGNALIARTYGWSDSLGVGPRTVDAKFLTVFARVTADSAAASIAANA